MKLKLWLVVGGVALGGALYFLPKTNVSQDAKPEKNEIAAKELTADEVYAHHFGSLDSLSKQKLSDLDQSMEKADAEQRDSLLFQKIKIWEQQNDLLMTGILFSELAKNANEPGPYLLESGMRFLGALESAADSAERDFASKSALQNLESATKAEPENLDYQASYAQAIALTDPAPLKGVSMLREILKKDPKHQKTWYILGVLAIQSNQLDKANGRFSFLNENYPNFPDAWYYRAQVLYSLGKTDSTVICLQKFKSLINDSMLKKEVQKQIEEIKVKH